MFRSNHPEFRLLEHACHERVFRPGALGKLRGRVHRGVNLPTQSARDPLRAPKTSPYVSVSLMTIRSMSLADWSVALATEP
jgi:hypothetical protein